MRSNTLFLFSLTALLLLLLLGGCGAAAFPAEEQSPPSPSAYEEAPSRTEADMVCEHRWENGVCVLCGESCPHGEGFVGGVCPVCSYACPHERHDENAVCLLCGEQRWHRYEQGLCTGCGREPLIFDSMLPERYLEPCEHAGSCLEDTLVWPNGREYPISVYLPYGYDEGERYDLVIFLLGDNDHAPDCTEALLTQHGVEFRLSWIYDHMLEEHLCAPFILVGVEHLRSLYDAEHITEMLRGTLLPRLVTDYATWAEGSDEASIAAARDHIALCGASRGGHYVLECGMRYCPDLIANFCSLSKGQITLSELNRFETNVLRENGVRCYVAGWGWNEPDAWSWDKRTYEKLVDRLDCLTEGENAFCVPVRDGHNWVTWSAGLFAALQYMF